MTALSLAGCYTALVTPFRDGRIDWDSFRRLIEDQIQNGIDGLVPMGTTGESPTVTMEEHKEVIRVAVETVNGRCPVIAGTGANNTEEAIELTRYARAVGADATLQVTPYYNKPSQEGLYRHFSKVADEGQLPVVLYNVPGRTGREIAIETVTRLARNTNIVAIKEAAGSVDRVAEIRSACDLTVLSGDDSLTVPMIAVGAQGVISVASNLIPAEMTRLVHLALDGNFKEARDLHLKLYPLFKVLFIETNPIPIKHAMAMRYGMSAELRLPLCEMSEATLARLQSVMKQLDLIPTN